MNKLPDFNPAQWKFLNVLGVFEGPVSIDVIGALSPLTPGKLVELLRQGEDLGWIRHTKDDEFELTANVPGGPAPLPQKDPDPDWLADLLDRLDELNLRDKLDPRQLAKILSKTNRESEAARLELKLAISELQGTSPDMAIQYLNQALSKLPAFLTSTENEIWLISKALEISKLCFQAGMMSSGIIQVLETARDLAEKTGEQRYLAEIYLHLGFRYFYDDRQSDAINALSIGKAKIEELGSADLMDEVAVFIGIYYYIQGLNREAIGYFEQAVQVMGARDDNPLEQIAYQSLGNCAANLGQFHRAIGSLDSYWHLALRKNKLYTANIIRAVLGEVLLLVNKDREALFHLKTVWQEARDQNNHFAIYCSGGALICYYLKKKEWNKAKEFFSRMRTEITDPDINSLRISSQHFEPYYLEALLEADQSGIDFGEQFRFHTIFQKVIKGKNIHLRGVVLRLKSKAALDLNDTSPGVLNDLLASETYLKKSGDPHQLAKTRLEMARWKLDKGLQEEARILAQQARRGLSIFWEDYFPDGLRFLLEGQETPSDVFESFLLMIEELIPKPDYNQAFDNLVSVVSRFFRAERVGLFWIEDEKSKSPTLKAARNLTKSLVEHESFRTALTLVFKTFRENQPQNVKLKLTSKKSESQKISTCICLPFAVKGQTRGVIYLDNSYLDNSFDFVESTQLERLSVTLSTLIERLMDYRHLIEQVRISDIAKSIQIETPNQPAMIFGSKEMSRLLDKADRFAKAGAFVLITGETGVGKEVLARWLHQNSHRSDKPFIVVDPTTIPETLVESELFGHVKGAFTGADRRKAGRIELAHGGTLFIDEIGEIKKSMQVKFLRVLQEKVFNPVGSNRTIESDFRLIAATNRNLSDEVAAGNFREDLYFRLNVLELEIPPLRERPDDVIQLARHFLSRYAKKHNHPHLQLCPEDEEKLTRHLWPGNIRELKNFMERNVLMSEDDNLSIDLPTVSIPSRDTLFVKNPTLDEVQRRYIKYVLEKTGNKVGGPGGAAEWLGIKRTSLNARMKKLGIR